MSFSKKTSEIEFQQRACGIYGTFVTAAGHVDYLGTKASLSMGPHSPETRLTRYLLPVREALPSSDMDFNQLLQRDLDDHRVATELVPYLLNPSTSGPAFFPPVVAVLLPFDGSLPKDKFDGDPVNNVNKDSFGDNWGTTTVGRSYRIERLLRETHEPHEVKLGMLHWNDECSKLVVVDGQHRAMALLAIHRTLTNTWFGAAEKYKSFYESAVNETLDGKTEEQRKQICSSVELPVTIVWFPNLIGESASHQVAARKLFVDVNKNARKPSASRLLLLSDRDLPSLFVRHSLNKFRTSSSFPIYAVEYDHPDSDEQTVSKWSVITNVGNISYCVRRLLMGPPKYFGMTSEISRGAETQSELADAIRVSLDILNTLPSNEEEDGISYKRSELSASNFPPRRINMLCEKYAEGWGVLIEKIFQDLLPFAVHAAALKHLYDGWNTADAASRLAKDAIFEGVGVYWTLKDGESHWKDLNSERALRGSPQSPKTDVITSWEILTAKGYEFRSLRSKEYLGTSTKDRDSDAAFEMFKTAACQIGLVLAVRALWETQRDKDFSLIGRYISKVIEALNSSLIYRKLVFVKSHEVVKQRFNLLDKLDTSKCVHFRYFWIQLLDTAEARVILSGAGMLGDLDQLVVQGRQLYRKELINTFKKSILKTKPGKDTDALKEATVQVDKHLSDGLKKFFSISKLDYQAWVSGINSDYQQERTSNSDEPEDEDTISESEHVESSDSVDEDDFERLIYKESGEN